MGGQSFRRHFWRWVYEGVRIGSIRGIQIRLHSALLVLIAFWLLTAGFDPEPLWAMLEVGLFAVVLFGSVLVHELGHCWGASRVGGESTEIVLWPLGGLASTSGSERSAFHEFVIVLAGPMVSLAVALAAGLGAMLIPESVLAATPAGRIFGFLLLQTRNVNAMLFVFNLFVPLFPMDSARLLRSLLSMRYSPERITYNLCLAGFFVAGVIVCLYFVAAFGPQTFFTRSLGFMLIFIAAFGIQSCILEMRRLEHSYVYSDPFPQGPPYRELPGRLLRAFGLARKRAQVIDMGARTRTAARPAPAIRFEESEAARPLTEREKLERELDEAVRKEEFGLAAELRDRLRSLTAGSPRR